MSLLIALALAFFVLPSPWGVIVVILSLFLEDIEITWGLKLARGRARVGAETMVGRTGEVVVALAPRGQIMLDGERWSARSTGSIGVGERVVVRGIDGVTLEVERAPD